MSTVRRVTWLAGAPFRAVLLGVIALYRLTLSGLLGGQCRYAPTCSHYGEEAIRTHGAFKGSLLAAWRVLRCNPFGKGGIEPVPARRTPRIAASAERGSGTARAISPADPPYDAVVHMRQAGSAARGAGA